MHTVIGYAGTRAFRVLWMLEELGLPYHHERLMPFTDAARARTPDGRLPALELPGGKILLDSTAILAFLADRNDSLTCPAGSVDRALQDAWMYRALESLDAPLMEWSLILQRVDADAEPSVCARVLRRIALGLEIMEQALAGNGNGPWLMGAPFTIADIVLGHCLHWAERCEQPVSRHPHLHRYLRAVQGRMAYVAADSA